MSVSLALLVVAVAVMELLGVAMRAAGLSEDAAAWVSIVALILAGQALVPFPPDRPSLSWAEAEPRGAGAALGLTIAAVLAVFFTVGNDGGTVELVSGNVIVVICATILGLMSARTYAALGRARGG